MKSTKCVECGFVGWSDVEYCKACGAQLSQRSTPPPSPAQTVYYDQWDEPEGQKNGMAIAALIFGIVSFLTFGLLGVGAITGIILASVAMSRVKRAPWKYGGRGMAIAGLVLSITSFVSLVPVGIIAAIAIPNLLAARMAANEGSAIHSVRTIAEAERVYYLNFNKYATIEELASANFVDSKLGSGTKNGYNFSIELTRDEDVEGFAVTAVPIEYRSSGRRSFYVDESAIVRAADNHGGPPTKRDAPLNSDSDYPSRARRADYQQEPVY
jgi:type II secretory pathway pseudopilin PulG